MGSLGEGFLCRGVELRWKALLSGFLFSVWVWGVRFGAWGLGLRAQCSGVFRVEGKSV